MCVPCISRGAGQAGRGNQQRGGKAAGTGRGGKKKGGGKKEKGTPMVRMPAALTGCSTLTYLIWEER